MRCPVRSQENSEEGRRAEADQRIQYVLAFYCAVCETREALVPAAG